MYTPLPPPPHSHHMSAVDGFGSMIGGNSAGSPFGMPPSSTPSTHLGTQPPHQPPTPPTPIHPANTHPYMRNGYEASFYPSSRHSPPSSMLYPVQHPLQHHPSHHPNHHHLQHLQHHQHQHHQHQQHQHHSHQLSHNLQADYITSNASPLSQTGVVQPGMSVPLAVAHDAPSAGYWPPRLH
ncbi:hypothetical protein FHG87_012038 [Trinorchestia longiramus]|nr:hypothetical protein FHG87_012038 [Trinorchestia longiramus]